jgi:negative regulator of sigma E activity
MNDAIRMQLSAYVDGALPSNEAELLLRRVCQDADLRQQIAQYLALQRFMRGEPGLAGADSLHERVAAEIDHRPVAAIGSDEDGIVRAMRPLAGFAIAASVALLAIFGLQQIGNSGGNETASPRVLVADENVVAKPGVPPLQRTTEQHRQYFLNHANASSRLGVNNMKFESVVLRFSEEFSDERILDVERDVDQGVDIDRTPDAADPDVIAHP